MRVTKVFVVRDPSEDSVPVDCIFESDVASQSFANYIVGAQLGTGGVWTQEHHAVYTKPAEAIADMTERFVRVRGGVPRGCAHPVAGKGELLWVKVPS